MSILPTQFLKVRLIDISDIMLAGGGHTEPTYFELAEDTAGAPATGAEPQNSENMRAQAGLIPLASDSLFTDERSNLEFMTIDRLLTAMNEIISAQQRLINDYGAYTNGGQEELPTLTVRTE